MKKLIRFIIYDEGGNLQVVERELMTDQSSRLWTLFDVCKFLETCQYGDVTGIICTEENDIIRGSVCPEFKKLSLSRAQKS